MFGDWLESESPANVYKDGAGSEVVNFKDFAVIAERWLDEDMFP